MYLSFHHIDSLLCALLIPFTQIIGLFSSHLSIYSLKCFDTNFSVDYSYSRISKKVGRFCC